MIDADGATRQQIAIYARVSTTDQNPELQLRELHSYAKSLGVPFTEYVDHGISGARDRRPKLDVLMKDARRHRFSRVVVYKFDRFARSVPHLVTALDEFRSLGIGFVSLTEAIDTTTPLGRAMFAIVGAIAEFERELIRERVKSGMAAARARGKHLGRPRAELDLVAVRTRLDQGCSIREVARENGVNHATVLRALARSARSGAEGPR